MVPLMNHAEKPIALALLREAWPDGSGEVAGPPFAWDPMPLGDMRRLAQRRGTLFDLGPAVETLDQVSPPSCRPTGSHRPRRLNIAH